MAGVPSAGGSAGGSGGGAGGGQAETGGTADGGAAIVDLFNGADLTGFDTYMQTKEKAPGTHLTMQQAQAIFKPENGTIHVYGDAAD